MIAFVEGMEGGCVDPVKGAEMVRGRGEVEGVERVEGVEG
jgi:hypothetical protein